MTALGLEHKQAVATSMAVIIATATAATGSNSRFADLVDWRIVTAMGLPSAVAALIGSDLRQSFHDQTLPWIYGGTLIPAEIRMLWEG